MKRDIICLSHLKWEETLFQRPQQIMKRLAQNNRIVYVANMNTRDFLKAWRTGVKSVYKGQPHPNLQYLNLPYLPFTRYLPVLRRVMNRWTMQTARKMGRKRGFQDPLLWLYHPGFVEFVPHIPHSRLVYDCMDQFTAFDVRHGKEQDWEQALLKQADLVFTGGRSLQKSKEGVNPRTHCYPSGVEYDHFHKAALEETPLAEDIRNIPGPILGYFGAIDERIDFDLIQYLCEKKPDWSIVFIGPLIHYAFPPVDRPNFHYLGKKPYNQLPEYLKVFDVCLMPFVDSDLTRHISPTKTPEYLAGGKPVVSSPVPDVMADYSHVVHIAADEAAFLAAVEKALSEQTADLAEQLQQIAAARSWEAIAAEMEQKIEALDQQGGEEAARA